MKIRFANQNDSKQLASLLETAFSKYRGLYTEKAYLSTTLTEELVGKRLSDGRTWVCYSESELIGSLSSKTTVSGLYLCGMVVHPEFQGLKLGWKLLRVAENFATSKGIDRMYLSTTPFLKRAIKLYEAFGFQKTADPPFDLNGTPLFTMEKLFKN